MFDRRKKIEPGPGQESVWDYPRPPKLESSAARIKIVYNAVTIAETSQAKRVLETSHAPVYYIPEQDIRMEYLIPALGNSFCEWKGNARYFDLLVSGKQEGRVAWQYSKPNPGYEQLEGHIAFYAGPLDACYVDGEKVVPQPGGFYGGWITRKIVGPFKGEPGTLFW